MTTLFKFANFIATELEEGVSPGDVDIHVPIAVTEKLPVLAANEEIRLVLWDGQQEPEIVAVTLNEQTGILTVVRGKEGTTPKGWAAGTQVSCVLTAEIINDALAAFFDFNVVLNASFLPLAGGTLTGPLLLSGVPTTALHAANKAYVDSIGAGFLSVSGGAMSGSLNMASNSIIGLPTPITASGAATKVYVDNLISGVQGQIAAGTAVYTTTGTASAYVVTTAGAITSYTDGFAIIIRPHVTNDAGATIKVDTAPAVPLHLRAGEAVGAGILSDRTPYTIVYDAVEAAFVAAGTINADVIPIGLIAFYPINALPTHWLQCDGTAISRTTFSALFSVIGTSYGIGNGTTTFNKPRMCDRIIICRDASSANLITGFATSTIGNTFGEEFIVLTVANLAPHSHGAGSYIAANHDHSWSGSIGGVGSHTHTSREPDSPTTASAGSGRTIFQERPARATSSEGAHGHSVSGTVGFSGSLNVTGTSSQTGSGTPINRLPPVIVQNAIIYAGITSG